MKTYTGIVRQCSSSDCREFWADEEHGPIIERLANAEEIPLETEVEIEVKDGQLVDWRQIGPARESLPRAHLAIFRVRPNEPTQRDHDLVAATARYVQNRIREAYPGQDIVVRGYAIEGPTITDTRQIVRSQWIARVKEIDPEFGQTVTYIGIHGGSSREFCGNAFLGARYYFVARDCGNPTHPHEFFHSAEPARLVHSGSTNTTYGHPWCWQGNHGRRHRLMAAKLDLLGAISPEHRHMVETNESRTFFLAEANANPEALLPGHHRVLYLDNHSIEYYQGEVHIDRPTDRSFANTRQLRSPIESGTVVGVGKGSVHFIDDDNGVGRVVVKGTSTLDEPELDDYPRLDAGEGPDLAGQSGLWHDPRYNHQGVALHVDDGYARGQIYTFTRAGNPSWIRFEGSVRGNRADLVLVAMDQRGQMKRDGDAWLWLDGPGTGFLRGYSDALGLFIYRLERLTPQDWPHELIEKDDTSGSSTFGPVALEYGRKGNAFTRVDPVWTLKAEDGLNYEPVNGYPLVPADSKMVQVNPG